MEAQCLRDFKTPWSWATCKRGLMITHQSAHSTHFKTETQPRSHNLEVQSLWKFWTEAFRFRNLKLQSSTHRKKIRLEIGLSLPREIIRSRHLSSKSGERLLKNTLQSSLQCWMRSATSMNRNLQRQEKELKILKKMMTTFSIKLWVVMATTSRKR